MNYLAILAAIFVFALQTVSFKIFNRTYMKNLSSYFIFNFLYFTVAVLVFLFVGGIPTYIDPYTLVLGITFGALFILTIFCFIKAMETGSMAYSSLFFSFGLIIPIIFGAFFWQEKISVIQLSSLGLLFVTFYLCSGASGDTKLKLDSKWVLFCFIAFIGNGGLMTLAKEHQILLPGKQVSEFLIISFGTAAVLSLVLFFCFYLRKQSLTHLKQRSFAIIVVAAGVTTAFGNLLGLYLNSRVPSILQFPTVNGGIVILSTVISSLFFGERLSGKGKTGLGIGIIALVLLCIK
jgi:drug/metabolite transporter (DMT)-like permease